MNYIKEQNIRLLRNYGIWNYLRIEKTQICSVTFHMFHSNVE